MLLHVIVLAVFHWLLAFCCTYCKSLYNVLLSGFIIEYFEHLVLQCSVTFYITSVLSGSMKVLLICCYYTATFFTYGLLCTALQAIALCCHNMT